MTTCAKAPQRKQPSRHVKRRHCRQSYPRTPEAGGSRRKPAAITGGATSTAPPSAGSSPTAEFSQAVEPPAQTKGPQEPPGIESEPFRFFAPTSIWNTVLSRAAPLDPESTPIVEHFIAEISSELAAHDGPTISTTSYGVPIYTVPPGQPTVKVLLTANPPAPALQEAFEQVPLPPDAQPSTGTDRTLVVWQPSTDRLWEFWRLVHGNEGWSTSWGGAMEHVSSGPGVYGPGVWPKAKTWWGSSASALSIAGGLLTFEDLERGRIDHALVMAIPNIRAGVYSSPAQRTDGKSTDPLSLPEGAHLRLDPSLDLSAMQMPPLTRMIAEAAQRYGIYIRDGARVAHFFAQDPVTLGTDPYAGPTGYFEGKYPGQLLAAFPWDHLQLLQMELHTR